MKNKPLRDCRGRFIKKQKFFKIVDPRGHHRMKYKEGINIDVLPFNPSGDCKPGGLYFASTDILYFLDYGPDVYEVEPIGEVYENPGEPKKFKAHSLNMKYIGDWTKDVNVLKYLIDNGADVNNTYNVKIYSMIIDRKFDMLELLINHMSSIVYLQYIKKSLKRLIRDYINSTFGQVDKYRQMLFLIDQRINKLLAKSTSNTYEQN